MQKREFKIIVSFVPAAHFTLRTLQGILGPLSLVRHSFIRGKLELHCHTVDLCLSHQTELTQKYAQLPLI